MPSPSIRLAIQVVAHSHRGLLVHALAKMHRTQWEEYVHMHGMESLVAQQFWSSYSMLLFVKKKNQEIS